MSGLPKDSKFVPATETVEEHFRAPIKQSFRGGAGTGHSEGVLERTGTFRVRGSDTRRVHLEDGTTEAVAI